jgi:GLPGLI family protein
MNHRSIFLFALSFLVISQVWSQKKFTEGTISYDIVINTGSEKPQNADFFDGATSAVYIKGGKIRTEMVSSLGTQSTILDVPNNQVIVLKEYGDQKYMIKMNPADWKDANRKYEDVKFTYDQSATKTILGYVCKKALGSLPDGTTFTVWYTSELVPENREFQYANRNLPGLALEYETTMGNLKVIYTVSKLSFGTVPAAKFDIPRTGYRILTYEESKAGN